MLSCKRLFSNSYAILQQVCRLKSCRLKRDNFDNLFVMQASSENPPVASGSTASAVSSSTSGSGSSSSSSSSSSSGGSFSSSSSASTSSSSAGSSSPSPSPSSGASSPSTSGCSSCVDVPPGDSPFSCSQQACVPFVFGSHPLLVRSEPVNPPPPPPPPRGAAVHPCMHECSLGNPPQADAEQLHYRLSSSQQGMCA